MSNADQDLSFEDLLARISELAEELMAHPDRAVSEAVGELLDWIDAMHREGLGQLVDMIRAWRGEIFLESVAHDPLAGRLLAAYGLGEDREVAANATDAVMAAIEEIRPYAESHGGSIQLDDITDGVVRVRLMGSCDGCPSSSATLNQGVEEALRRHFPGFRRLEVTEPEPVASLVPQPEALLQIRGHEQR